MYLENRNKQKAYKQYTGAKGMLGGGGTKKVRAVNLDGERPFAKGNGKRGYVNPTHISNMVFYGHSSEPIDYPHTQMKKGHLLPQGYDFNNYVIFDGHRTEASTVVPSMRSTRTESKRV